MRLKADAFVQEKYFGAVVDDVRRLLRLHYKEMAKLVSIDWDRLRNFHTRGTKVRREEFRDILKLVEGEEHRPIHAYLQCKYPMIFDAPGERSFTADVGLAQWVGARDQRQTTFYRECIERPHGADRPRGRFLLMRRDDEGKLICALMRIAPPVDGRSLPAFNTIRSLPNGMRRKTHGFIFEHHGRVYSIGKLDGLTGLRFANLHIQQHGSRTDLFGLRLGILRDAAGLTFASRIYGYQIRRSARSASRTPGILNRILQPWHPEGNDDLVASISNFHSIYDLLRPEPLRDNGITAPG